MLSSLDIKASSRADDFIVGLTGGHPEFDIPHNYIHISSFTGDAPLLCEMIRVGASIDIEDVKGRTGLFLALENLVSCQVALHADIPLPMELHKQPVSAVRTMLARLEYIACILIEQHADVNHAVNGISPLHLACRARNWNLIALLLEHGANPSPAPATQYPAMLLSSSTDKTHFLALVKKFPSGRPRPGRMCPCFSGKTLSVCHAADARPYPPSLLCMCASGKSFEKCCARRKMIVSERWDEKRERLEMNIKCITHAIELSEYLGEAEPGYPFGEFSDNQSALKIALQQLREMADELLAMGVIDAAYAYALNRLNFWPRPQGRKLSKRECCEIQKKWNAAVDKYISLERDKRSRDEIERAAKIGPSNGALYRRCEGMNCDKVEGKNMQKPLFCSACKMSVYCGAPCQKSVWKSHKAVCGSDNQHEQALPSQQALDAYVIPKLYDNLTKLDLTQAQQR